MATLMILGLKANMEQLICHMLRYRSSEYERPVNISARALWPHDQCRYAADAAESTRQTACACILSYFQCINSRVSADSKRRNVHAMQAVAR